MVFDYNEVIQVGKVGSESFEKLYAMPKLKKFTQRRINIFRKGITFISLRTA